MNPHARLLAAIGGLPDTYLVIDTETNGMGIADPLVLPTQLGYLLVVDRVVVDCDAIVVNWGALLTGAHRSAFWQKCRDVEYHMGRNGGCQVPVARILAEGEDPRDAWPAYLDMLATALREGHRIAGHNIVRFDCPLLSRVALQMDTQLDFPAAQLLDLGLFEKAINAGLDLPGPARGLGGGWYAYAGATPSKAKWSLAACTAKYALQPPRLGAAAGPHDAAYDCASTYALAEAYRELAGATDGPAHLEPARTYAARA